MKSRSGIAVCLLGAALAVIGALAPGGARAQATAGKITFESWEATGTAAVSRSRVGVVNGDGTNATNLTDTTNAKFDDWNPAFNRTGSKIVFLSDRTGRTDVYVMNADGTGQTRLTRNSSLAIAQPQFSPDGTKITFFAVPINVANATWEIYLMNTDGSGLVKLTTSVSGTGGVTGSVFTPDGKHILFEGTPAGGPGVSLCEMNLDGSGVTLLTTLVGGSASSPSFSPDGTTIALAVDGRIVLMNSDGTGQRTVLTAAFPGSPTFSPDGSRLVLGLVVDNAEQVYTMNTDGSDLIQITFGPGISPPSAIESNAPGSWAPGSVGRASLVALSVSPSSVLPGAGSVGTVSLSSAAPVGGVIVALSSASPAATVPATVAIPAGATTANFPIATSAASPVTAVIITATFGGVTQQATLRIDPAAQQGSVTVTKAEYTTSQKQLQVQATSSITGDIMSVYVTSTGAFVGTMTGVGGGKYQLQIALASNPLNVTVRSSLGASASLNVAAK